MDWPLDMPARSSVAREPADQQQRTTLMMAVARYVQEGGTAAKVALRNLATSERTRVNAHDTDGDTALMYAVAQPRFPHRHGRELDATEILLDAGADPNLSNKIGVTALMYSVTSGHLEVTRSLLGAGANVNMQDTFGFTSLMYCLNQRHHCSRLDRLNTLISAGADINIADNEGNTLLMHTVCRIPLVARRRLPKEVTEGILRTVIAAGADVDTANNTGLTALHFACLCDHELAVRVLLEFGRVDVRSSLGRTPLCFALWNKNREVVDTLFKAGAPVSSELVVAVLLGLCDTVRTMLRGGARPVTAVVKLPMVLIPRRRRNFYWKMKYVFGQTPVSPLMAAIVSQRLPLAQLFLSLRFLSPVDLHIPSRCKQRAVKLLEKNEEALTLFKRVYEQPRSLLTLCLVAVSDALGVEGSRADSVAQLQLPNFLQDMLMYKVRISGEFDIGYNNSTRAIAESNDDEDDDDEDVNDDMDDENDNLYHINDSDDSDEDNVEIIDAEDIDIDDDGDESDDSDEEDDDGDLLNLFSDHEVASDSDEEQIDVDNMGQDWEGLNAGVANMHGLM